MKKWWKNKMVWVMPLLVLVTLFLLEIPRQYYKYEDSRILEESGSSKYETQRIQGIDRKGNDSGTGRLKRDKRNPFQRNDRIVRGGM